MQRLLRAVGRVAIVRNMLKPPAGGFVEMVPAADDEHYERRDVGRRAPDAASRCASIAPAIGVAGRPRLPACV
jgi:hypothetical protein